MFREIKLKTFLIFSQKKALLTFQDTKTQKTSLYLRQTELSYISGNINRKKTILQEVTLQARKIKNNS